MYFEIWVDGERCDDAEIVSVGEGENYLDEAGPGPSLADIDAILRYVQSQFPNGWCIIDGKVCAWNGYVDNRDEGLPTRD